MLRRVRRERAESVPSSSLVEPAGTEALCLGHLRSTASASALPVQSSRVRVRARVKVQVTVGLGLGLG